MKAAQYALSGRRLIVLDKFHINSCFFIIIVIISFHKISTLIAEHCRCDNLQTFNFTCFHCYFSHSNYLFSVYFQLSVFYAKMQCTSSHCNFAPLIFICLYTFPCNISDSLRLSHYSSTLHVRKTMQSFCEFPLQNRSPDTSRLLL